MKSRIITLFSLIFLFLSLYVSAQPPDEATPSNYTMVAQEIADLLGVNCYQSPLQIATFMGDQLTGTSAACPIPDADMTQYNQNSVSFSWPGRTRGHWI